MCDAFTSTPPRVHSVFAAAAMYRSFSPNMVRPTLPLRKPSSSPMALFSPRPPAPPRGSSTPDVAPVSPASSAIGEEVKKSPVSKEQSAALGSTPPALTVYFCNFCGQQGHFRCKRCKATPYCSVMCLTEDWQAHKHMCKSVVSEPSKEKPKETASPLTGDGAGLHEAQGDASSLKRVYLKDLDVTKITKGTDIQASVVEFYSPGRFFIIVQSCEQLEALQNISKELQKTYICPSAVTHVPHVGEVCAVQFSCDLNWYRGLVQTVAADQKAAYILYIDFGNEEDVPVDRIKPLAANIKPYCPCVMECRIAGLVPVANSWSDECSISVKQLLAGKIVTVRLVETREINRIHDVDILLSTGKKLSTFLLEHGYAAAQEVENTAPTHQDITAILNASMENFRRLSDGKDDNTWAQPPEPLVQTVGDSFSVMMTHVKSPSEFVIQKVQNAGVIQDLQIKLREHCSQIPPPQNFRPAPGTVCCAQFSEDKQWYRAKVMAYSSEERVCVNYLDFGNSEEVDLGCLLPITTSLLALPMQAIPCGLAGIQPVGESWSKDCLLALQGRVLNQILRVDIQGTHEGKALVAMFEASESQANIAELLTSAGLAKQASIPASSDQQAEQRAAPALEPDAGEPLVWSCTELPCDGQTVALLVSVVENPSEFYCRINNPSDHERLIELGTELKRHCEATVLPFEPKVGQPCCALFPDDGEWYRAMVGKVSEELQVTLVDYGYSMKVEKNHIQSITQKLLTLPFLAIRCWLAGVEPLGSEWSSEAQLCFQSLVEAKQLSARVLSVTEQGYGLELECGGQNLATALVSQKLAKVLGATPTETQATTMSGRTNQEKTQENEPNQRQACASNPAVVTSKETPSEGHAAVQSEAASYPVDWKMVELPINESFQPCIVAVTSPSLFYLLSPTQVDQQKLQEVMMELAAYCSNIQASTALSVLSRPAAGAACCAQFSADSKWYRAVVLEVSENEARVIYADYGNTETVPFSRILPIPAHLLQLPFQIVRCTLTGKEHLPADKPEQVLQVFQSLLSSGVFATVTSFDGSDNVLSLTLPTKKGVGHMTNMILESLQDQTKSNSCPSINQKANTSTIENPAATTSRTTTPEPTAQTPQEKKNTSALADNVQQVIDQMEPPSRVATTTTHDPQTSACCCLNNLVKKIDHLELLVQRQLCLITQLVAQTK